MAATLTAVAAYSTRPTFSTRVRTSDASKSASDDRAPRVKRQKTSTAASGGSETPNDPHAANFLRDALGHAKYAVFAARLFEQRLSNSAKTRTSPATHTGADGEERDAKPASMLDFLVKVEIVKEALRKYVPHPYHPVKSRTHQYAQAPSGCVTLTRTTVLALSGWSNTQFAYWARRVEGVSVLRRYDSTLAAVAAALDGRLTRTPAPGAAGDEGVVESITGKSLDKRITDVAQTHSVSPFLRGRHCSLDPFGAGGMGIVADSVSSTSASPSTPAIAPQQQQQQQFQQHPPVRAPSMSPPSSPRSSPSLLDEPIRRPHSLSLFAFPDALLSKLSYSISDSRSSSKRQRPRRRDGDMSGTSSDDDADEDEPSKKRARLLSQYLAMI